MEVAQCRYILQEVVTILKMLLFKPSQMETVSETLLVPPHKDYSSKRKNDSGLFRSVYI